MRYTLEHHGGHHHQVSSTMKKRTAIEQLQKVLLIYYLYVPSVVLFTYLGCGVEQATSLSHQNNPIQIKPPPPPHAVHKVLRIIPDCLSEL